MTTTRPSLLFARLAPSAGVLLLCSLALAACGGDERGPYPLEPGRERPAPDREVPEAATALERLGVRDEQGRPMLVPTLPQGWQAQPASSMRVISARVLGSGAGDGDLSVSWAGGDVASNVSRWLGQFGLPPVDEQGIDALPRGQLAGGPAVLVEAKGRYDGGMGSAPAADGQMLLGMVSLLPGRDRLFVKLVGPDALVEAQREAFITFCATLVRAGTATTAPRPVAAPTAGSAPVPGSTPAPGSAAPAATPPAGPRAGLDAGRLAWDLPRGWKAQKPRGMMRIMDFRVEGAAGTEGVLFQLAGDGGGVALNINRWRGQMGQPELAPEAIAALPRVRWLGRDAAWVEITGTYQGMSGERVEGALFVGVVCLLQADSLFFRLVGPKAEVEPQREALRSLLASMREGG